MSVQEMAATGSGPPCTPCSTRLDTAYASHGAMAWYWMGTLEAPPLPTFRIATRGKRRLQMRRAA